MKTIQYYGEVTDDFSLIKMCGRMVQVKKRQDGEMAWTRNNTTDADTLGTTCADCYSEAPFIIKELNSDYTWCYCGICEIGG